jgi:hypothetical protein
MLGHVGRRIIYFLIGSTIFATFIGYVLYKAGLLSFPGNPKNQRAVNRKERNQNRRVGKIRVI